MIQTLSRELRNTLRSLRKEPGFVLATVLTVALGIGATTLVFSVVHGVLLKPLPYREPDRLVNVWNHLVEERQFLPAVHAGDFRDYQAMSQTFEEFAATAGNAQVGLSGVLTGDGPPLSVDLSPVTYNFFSMLGVDPILGRHFTEEEEAVGAAGVAILSYELWSSRFGRDETLLGRNIQIDGREFSVVGILPRGFRLLLPDEAFQAKHSDVWVPMQVDYGRLPPRNWTGYTVLGRLKPDVTLEQAQAEMDRIAAELRATYPAHANSGMQIHLVPLQQDVVKAARPTLLILFAAVGFVLLLACANVAHLLLCRGTALRKEMAMRTALGASRGVIVRRVWLESLTIGFLGAGLGLALTQIGLRILVLLQPSNLPRLTELEVSGAVWAFAAVAALLTSGAFGLAPVLHALRTDVTELLRDGTQGGPSKGAAGARNLLVVGELAFSLALLVGAGLMFRSFQALQRVDPGFEPERALTFTLSLPRADYPQAQATINFYDELRDRLLGLPGVEAVGAISQLPFTGQPVLWPYAYDAETAEDFNLSADGKTVFEGYFEAMGTRVVAGRAPSRADAPLGPSVVVEEMLARRAWPGQDPVGQPLTMRFGEREIVFTVAAVVEHIRVYDLRRDVREHIYIPYTLGPGRTMSVVVRTAGDPLSLAGAVQNEVWALDPDLPLDDLRPLQDYVRDQMAHTRFAMLLMAVFGGLALLLAVVGVYGVNAYAMGQRSREFGIRLALGAPPGGLIRFVVLGGARTVLVGLGAGFLASFLLARVMRGLLFEVGPMDTGTYAALALILGTAGLLAAYVPARRAARSDPVATLRAE